MTTGLLKVSVVVPTYNSGEHLQQLFDSLLRQSMPATEFEVIVVDDGSTDDTPARLAEWAAAHPHVEVLRAEHSGWPSRPRNLGLARARGEYVQFVDDDDWLADEALARLYGYAVANGADIAIGKMTGHGRAVPRELFRVNRPDARLDDSPLIESLTCHKMFRRAFLLEHDLRFPEEHRKRLEDHHLVARAYLLSKRTCVLSDYTCYHHARRPDGGNLTASRMEPAGYYSSLREVLDIVDTHTEPGPLRDKLHRRWLRSEMIRRLRGARLLNAPRDWVDQVAAEVQKTVEERFTPAVAGRLPAVERTVAGLVAEGRVEDLLRLAEWDAGIRAKARLKAYELTGLTLTLMLSGQLHSNDQPVSYAPSDGRYRLVVPIDDVPAELLDCTAELGRARLDVIARHDTQHDEFFLPVHFEVDRVVGPAGELQLRYRGTAMVDFGTLNGGRTQGEWILKARISGCGWTLDAKLPLAVSCAADGARPVVVDKRKKKAPAKPPQPRPGGWRRLARAVRRRLGLARPQAVRLS
ncbi:glycosyltransferase family 2 protein [Micromonospora zingiberis]|uniref:Glycosyltransferase family 2 protein n=1 Tax=Micromonospora zingiberis TaxID=2053011 RepID=A0A4R0GPM1_9ACTN|nr:glycosyltransferase family 2 protein [Micromonospora zingiberis]TCB97541.1 glycosyltransferase family 2 protein [Micromonospora zingiberis]